MKKELIEESVPAMVSNEAGHPFVRCLGFTSERQREMVNGFAAYAEMNGLSMNEVIQMVPVLCRMAGADKGSDGWA